MCYMDTDSFILYIKRDGIYKDFFSLSGFFFADTDNSQDSRGREGTIFYSALPLPPAYEHSDMYFATLHVRWLSHIFNGTTCIYQAASSLVNTSGPIKNMW